MACNVSVRGTLYGVGVGPGDPELLTQKAVRVLSEVPVIACPMSHGGPGLAYQIAVQAVPALRSKKLLALPFPMSDDRERAHAAAAAAIEDCLWQGQDVAFLTLGDPSVYSTFGYLLPRVREDGFPVQIICGVPSFCAAAAALLEPLALGTEEIHILPAEGYDLSAPGTLVLMKPGGDLRALRAELSRTGRDVWLAVRCGLPGEALYHGCEAMPDEIPYFSLLIIKETKEKQDAF